MTLNLKMDLEPICYIITSKDVFRIFSHMYFYENYQDHLKFVLISVTTPQIYLVMLVTVQCSFTKGFFICCCGEKRIIFELSSLFVTTTSVACYNLKKIHMLLILQATMQNRSYYCFYFINKDNQEWRGWATYVCGGSRTQNHFFSDFNLFYYLMELNSLALEYFLGYYATMDVWVGDHILQMT